MNSNSKDTKPRKPPTPAQVRRLEKKERYFARMEKIEKKFQKRLERDSRRASDIPPQVWDYNPARDGRRIDAPADGGRASWHVPPAPFVSQSPLIPSRSVGWDVDTRPTPSHGWHTDDRRRGNSEDRKRRRESRRIDRGDDSRPVEKYPREESFPNIVVKDLKQIPEFEERIPEGLEHQHIAEEQENGEDSSSECIQMVIIDEGNPKRELSKANKTIVENKLTRRLLKAAKEGQAVQFDTQVYDGKHLKYACANQETCEWLKNTISGLNKLWEGASLTVIPEKELPTFCSVRTFIPGLGIAQDSCMTALAGQNPKLDIGKWVISNFDRRDDLGGYQLTFGVPEQIIPEIKACRGKAYFMFSKIKLEIIDYGENNHIKNAADGMSKIPSKK